MRRPDHQCCLFLWRRLGSDRLTIRGTEAVWLHARCFPLRVWRLHFNQSSSVIHAALTLAQLFYCQRSFGQKSPKSNKMFYRPGSVPINQALHTCSNTLKSKPNQLQEPAVRLGTRNYTIMQMWGHSERKPWREITWRYHLCMSNRGGEPGERLKLPCWEGKDWTRGASAARRSSSNSNY